MESQLFGMPLDLYIVRHGQSIGNLTRKKFEDSGDESFYSEKFLSLHESQYPLTKLGRTQAKQAGKWFWDNQILFFDRMLVSNNVRAMETASCLKLPEPKWKVDFNLRERDAGFFNNIKPSAKKNYSDQQKFHDSQPFLFRPPQGESIADVCLRVKIVLDTLSRECNGKKVIIVCHGHVMRVFRIILERMSPSKINSFITTPEEWGRIPNCAIIHYTRRNPNNVETPRDYFDWVRMIRPAGGGKLVDDFSEIKRKQYSNAELLAEAKLLAKQSRSK